MFRPTREVSVAGLALLFVVTIAAAQGAQQAPPSVTPAAQPAKPPTGFILGRVVDAGSGRLVSGAMVNLLGGPGADTPTLVSIGLVPFEEIIPSTGSAPATPTQVIADSNGRFVFRSLARGSYGLSVRASGYVPGAYGQRRPSGPSRRIALEEDQKLTDATVRIWKFASIAGRLVDEAGEAAIGASVSLARVTTSAGRRRFVPAGTAATDDRGQYRFGSLTPGTYIVHVRSSVTTLPMSTVDAYQQAMSSPGAINEMPRELIMMGPPTSGLRIGDHQLQFSSMTGRSVLPPPPAADGRMSVYQTLFYPSATLSSQAAPLTLSSGEERSGIDLQLKLARAVTVSGVVHGPDGPGGMIAVRLQPGGAEEFSSDSGLDAATSVTAADGSFVFLGVPAGSYTLHAQRVPRATLSSASSMTTVIQMGSGGVMMSSGGIGTPPPTPTDPTLWARVPVAVGESDVRGIPVTLSKGARISGKIEFAGAAQRPTPERLAQLGVALTSADAGFLSGFTPGRISADGTFATMSYPPGRYTLSVPSPSPPWTIRSITVAGKDVFSAPLELGPNDLTGVVVTFGDTSTELLGTARAAGSAADVDAVVAVLPADVQAWIDSGMSPRRARTVATSTTGEYRIAGLPPGDYLVLAVDPNTNVDLQDAQFVSAAARVATRVSLSDGEKKSLSLTVSQIK